MRSVNLARAGGNVQPARKGLSAAGSLSASWRPGAAGRSETPTAKTDWDVFVEVCAWLDGGWRHMTVAPDTIHFMGESSEGGGPWRTTEDYRHVRVSRLP